MLLSRSIVSGGTYFFTVDLDDCRSGLLVERAHEFGVAIRAVRHTQPLDVIGWVLLPDHLHAVWTLPDGDADVAGRWSRIRAHFAGDARDPWQKGWRERLLKDERDVRRHVDYLHFNPVKHGYVGRAADWPYSSVHRYIRDGLLDDDWAGDGRTLDAAG